MRCFRVSTEVRLPLWSALSWLFLDTEVSTDTHRYIARQVIDSGLSPESVLEVLWLEVFPALCDNLRDVAGEWATFDDDWLCQRIADITHRRISAYRPMGMLSINQVIAIVEAEWVNCCRYLPAVYSAAVRPANRRIKQQGASRHRFFGLF